MAMLDCLMHKNTWICPRLYSIFSKEGPRPTFSGRFISDKLQQVHGGGVQDPGDAAQRLEDSSSQRHHVPEILKCHSRIPIKGMGEG